METKLESVFCVYKNKELIAIIKRDDTSKKHLVYLAEEASSEDIANLIAPALLTK
jgi:hypothetical protein